MTDSPESICSSEDCGRPACMAVRTTRPQRDNCVVTVYTDDRAAKVPKAASRYCAGCGTALVTQLLRVLVDIDDEAQA